ncbi:MAG: septum formation initiator family protein [Candidatus Omnitrophica bacterium]|nr:septum formation initiator family protein [Candidatus Omnitrophota bacterium]
MQDHRQKNLEYEKKIAELQRRNEELKEEKQRLIEDPVYLERVARERMGLVREGEKVYKIEK